MKKVLKRILASLLVVVMIFIAEPLSGFVGMELKLDWLAFTSKASAAQYVFPVTGGHSISQYFSSSHGAIDVANCAQQPVVATATGTVIRVDNNCQHTNYSTAGCTAAHNSTCGNCVYIKHDDTGYVSVYGHLYPNSICVSVGEKVQAGQQIGLVGSSGMSTGFHLHFEIRPYANDYNNWYRDSENVNVNPGACSYIYLDSPQSVSPPTDKVSKGDTGPTSKVYVGNNIAYFSWNEDPNAEYYNVRIWKKENGTETTGQYDVWSVRSLSTSVILPDGEYRGYIHACGSNYSSKKEDLNFTVVKESPMISVSSYRLSTTLSWPTVSGASSYEIRIYRDKLWVPEKLVVSEANLKSTSYTTTLPVGNYQTYVNYFDSSGKLIQQTAGECFTVKESVYAFTENNVVYISWNENPSANKYNVRIRKVENGVWLPDDYSLWSVTGSSAYTTLPPGYYVIYVDAFEENQTVKSNEQYFTVTLKDPILSSSVSGEKVHFSWTTYPNAHHYSIDVYKDEIWSGEHVYTSNQIYGQSLDLELPEGKYKAYINPLDANNNRLLAYSGSVEEFTITHTHQYASKVTKKATCTENGTREYSCSSCGNTYTECIASLGHNHIIDNITEPTCTEQGFTTYACTRCDNSYNTNFTDVLNHPSSTWYTAVNPTAAANGLAEKRCDNCGKVLDQFIIPSLVPDYVTGISLSSQKETVEIGDVFTLTATIIPDTAKNKNVIWSSRNPEIVTVDNGTVKAIKPGTTAIVAESEDGGFIDFCLVRVVSLVAINGAVIDNDSNIIYGLTCNLNSVDDYLEPVDNNMSISLSTATVGTGTTVSIINNGEVIDSYEAIIFGDVNGDGRYDGQDAIIVECIVNGMLTKDDVGEAVYKAADCNHDGTINSEDVDLLGQAGLMQQDIFQIERTVSG